MTEEHKWPVRSPCMPGDDCWGWGGGIPEGGGWLETTDEATIQHLVQST
jgi:hypothetical protein